MNDSCPRCPACCSTDLSDLGALPERAGYAFAGGVTVSLGPSHFLRCERCALHFRHPVPSADELAELYEAAPDSSWEYERRSEWCTLARWLHRFSPNRHILDVGCFRGDFLHWLGPEWKRAGIEPSNAARVVACARGIDLIARSLFEVPGGCPQFGAITFLDVLEHFGNPLAALDAAKKLLAPSGIFVIYTATTDAWAWRAMAHEYWYCGFPEHLTFINNRWLCWASNTLGLSILRRRRLSHWAGQPTERFRDGCRVLAYQAMKSLRRSRVPNRLMRGFPLLGRAETWTSPPESRHLNDHILVALRSKSD